MKTSLTPLDSAGIILSYHCRSACKHCLYACGPKWNDWMSESDVEDALDAIESSWFAPRGIHIAGGEAFHRFELLLYAVKAAVQRNMPIEYVETNAEWCGVKSTVQKRFEQLKNVGLKRILISCSPFHAERIPPHHTILANSIAEEVFGPGGVILYWSHWLGPIASFGTDKPIPLSRYIDKFGEDTIGTAFWFSCGLIPGGRSGYRLGHLVQKHSAIAWDGVNCKDELFRSAHGHLYCAGLTFGSWRELPRMIQGIDLSDKPILEILSRSGPYGLRQFARENFDYKDLQDGYVGKCHLCVDVRRHLVHKADFPELKPRLFYENL